MATSLKVTVTFKAFRFKTPVTLLIKLGGKQPWNPCRHIACLHTSAILEAGRKVSSGLI